MFEWWYFRKYGTSFIEQLSVSHLGPLLGVNDDPQLTQQQKSGIKQHIDSDNVLQSIRLMKNKIRLLKKLNAYLRRWHTEFVNLESFSFSISFCVPK